MIDCIILGDSIAVGTQMYRPECVAYALSGINTGQWNKKFKDRTLTASTVIISLGSNDHRGVKTEAELMAMRDRVTASRVFWVLPYGNGQAAGVDIATIQATVKAIAAKHGDTVLPITRVQPDRIHPSWAGYKDIANQTK